MVNATDQDSPPPAEAQAGAGLAVRQAVAAVSAYLAAVGRGEPLPGEQVESSTESLHRALGGAYVPELLQSPLADLSDYGAVHAVNVALLAMALAGSLEFPGEDVRDVGTAGLLYDVGMARVPLDLLRRPDQLDAAERELIKQHPVTGARLIIESERPRPLAAIVAYEHHRRIDGGGYPRPRYQREAQLASRLVQVCDVYDALRTPRPFRQAWPAEIIRSFLQARAGIEFDPRLARAFLELIGRAAGADHAEGVTATTPPGGQAG